MRPYAIWKVNDEEEYKLVLQAAQICDLEDKLAGAGRNLLGMIGSNATGMPALKTMLTVTQAAMARFHHGMKLSDVYEAFDRFCEAGGNQVDFYSDVYLKIFEVSGFFPVTDRNETV